MTIHSSTLPLAIRHHVTQLNNRRLVAISGHISVPSDQVDPATANRPAQLDLANVEVTAAAFTVLVDQPLPLVLSYRYVTVQDHLEELDFDELDGNDHETWMIVKAGDVDVVRRHLPDGYGIVTIDRDVVATVSTPSFYERPVVTDSRWDSLIESAAPNSIGLGRAVDKIRAAMDAAARRHREHFGD